MDANNNEASHLEPHQHFQAANVLGASASAHEVNAVPGHRYGGSAGVGDSMAEASDQSSQHIKPDSRVTSQALHNPNGDRKTEAQEWISFWLKPGVVGSAAAFTILHIGAITGLIVYSNRHHGIRSVNVNAEVLSSIIPTFDLGLSLCWTYVPVLIFSLYAWLIGSIISSAAARQPYIELREQGNDSDVGAPAKKSILLDYSSYSAPHAPLVAFKYGHYTLCFGFLVVLVLSLGLTPLASHLFFATTVQVAKDIHVEQSDIFYDDLLDPGPSLVPVMGIVSSTVIYGGEYLPWTTSQEAFIPFVLATADEHHGQLGNLSVPTLAYSVGLDCKVLGPSEFELVTGDDGSWYFSISDRGCSLTDQLYTPALSPYYVDFVYYHPKVDCSFEAQFSRVVVVAALNANGSRTTLTNKTAISCIPTYYNSSGLLNVAMDPSNSQSFVIDSFTSVQRQKIEGYPSWGLDFMFELEQAQVFDNTATVLSNDFGLLVYNYAKKLSTDSYFNGPTLLNATQTLFDAAYAVMVHLYRIRPSPVQSIEGTLYTSENRLIVVRPVAYTMIGIIGAIIPFLGWIYRYVTRNHSILYEEPTGMLTLGHMLLRSDLNDFIREAELRSKGQKVGKEFLEMEKEEQNPVGWVLRDFDDPPNACLKCTTRVRSDSLWERRKKRNVKVDDKTERA